MYGIVRTVGSNPTLSAFTRLALEREAVRRLTGCSAAWLARLTGGQEVDGSNPSSPIRLGPWQDRAESSIGEPVSEPSMSAPCVAEPNLH